MPQVYNANLLKGMDESSTDPVSFRELQSATNLIQRAIKATTQVIGKSMALSRDALAPVMADAH